MANRKTRRNSRRSASSRAASSRAASSRAASRKASASRKSTRKAQAGGKSDWNKKVMEVYRELKSKNPATRLGDAMREASRRYKK